MKPALRSRPHPELALAGLTTPEGIHIRTDTSRDAAYIRAIHIHVYTPRLDVPVPYPSRAPCEFSAVDTLRNDVLHYYNIVGTVQLLGAPRRFDYIRIYVYVYIYFLANTVYMPMQPSAYVWFHRPSPHPPPTLNRVSLFYISSTSLEGVHYVFMCTLRCHLSQTIDIFVRMLRQSSDNITLSSTVLFNRTHVSATRPQKMMGQPLFDCSHARHTSHRTAPKFAGKKQHRRTIVRGSRARSRGRK